MELTITIDWNDVKKEVCRHLSYIGKRLEDKTGNTLFAKITMSSEEVALLQQYVKAAAEIFVGELAPLATYYNEGSNTVFKIKNMRWGDSDGICVAFKGSFVSFTVAYVANAVLGMTNPELAKKYETDMQNQLNAAVKLVYYKNQPTDSGKTLADMTGEVTLD